MTPDRLRALQADILASAACAPHVHTAEMPPIGGDEALARDTAIAAILSAGRTRLRQHWMGERGVISTLGTQAGEAFLQALAAFAAAQLPEGHPLAADHPGIARMLAWLKSDEGIDIGDAQTQLLLGVLSQAGVLDPAHAAAIAARGHEPDPVTPGEVGRALRGPWGDEG